MEQGNPGRGDFVENLLGQGPVLSRLQGPQMRHPLIAGVLDGLQLVLEHPDPEQPVQVGRLLFRRDPEPGVVRIEGAGRRVHMLKHNLRPLNVQAIIYCRLMSRQCRREETGTDSSAAEWRRLNLEAGAMDFALENGLESRRY